MSAERRRSRTAPAPPVRRVTGTGLSRAEQHRRPVIVAVPPANGKSTPLPWILTILAIPRSSRMSPPATIVQVVAGSNDVPPATVAGSWAIEWPAGRRLDPIDPEEGLRAPAEGPDGGRDLVGPEERQTISVGGQVLDQGGGALGQDQRLAAARPGHAEPGQDRVGVGGDDLHGRVAAGPGQRRADVARLDRRLGRAEVDDRDDRDGGDRAVGRGRGRVGPARVRRAGIGRGAAVVG